MHTKNLPPFWLRNGHIQTLLPKVLRKKPRLDLQRERVELQDGDFIDLDCSRQGSGQTILILHGLEGSLDSHYAGPLVHVLEQRGFCPVFMYLRGCSETPNRLQRSYHSGSSDDLAEVLHYLYTQGRPVFGGVGFSLGGNILLKYLGETGAEALLHSAVAVSVPFQLDQAAKRLTSGTSRIYQQYLLKKLKKTWKQKTEQHQDLPQVDTESLQTIEEYDDKITAPLNGFSNAKEYYRLCSSGRFLSDIRTPTLLLQAQDDPFTYPETIPDPDILHDFVELRLHRYGGHVGFITSSVPWRVRYLLDEEIPRFFENLLNEPR